MYTFFTLFVHLFTAVRILFMQLAVYLSIRISSLPTLLGNWAQLMQLLKTTYMCYATISIELLRVTHRQWSRPNVYKHCSVLGLIVTRHGAKWWKVGIGYCTGELKRNFANKSGLQKCLACWKRIIQNRFHRFLFIYNQRKCKKKQKGT